MVYQKKQSFGGFSKLKSLAIWQVVVLLILVTIITATLLRMNNVRMLERKEAVIAADKSGDHGMVHDRLRDLQEYVFKHMNASTGQIFLEQIYRQKVDQLINDAKNTISSNHEQNAYKIASEICDQKFRGYSQAYAECFLSEVNKHTTSVNPVTEVKLPSPNLYIVNFSSPTWSPDLAGFAVVVWAMLALYLSIKIITLVSLRLFIRIK